MSAGDGLAELTAAVDEVFATDLPDVLPDDLLAIVSVPYSPNVLLAYAYRENARYIPAD